ncbi:MAG: triose-phosphate isomerase [candidate division WOR-3 bacterium]
MRKMLIGGNWKMYNGVKETANFAKEIKEKKFSANGVDVFVAPPFTSIPEAIRSFKDTGISIGAQNLFWEDKGAYTGEISPLFLKELGVEWVIIGHSERRTYFGETNATVRKKVEKALKEGLKVVLCIGETERERDEGKTKEILNIQIEEALLGIEYIPENLAIAYEPVWAIGSGKTPHPEEAEEMHSLIREKLGNKGEKVRIIYGGSVKTHNIREFISKKNIDGALIGGASLEVNGFIEMVNIAKEIRC